MSIRYQYLINALEQLHGANYNMEEEKEYSLGIELMIQGVHKLILLTAEYEFNEMEKHTCELQTKSKSNSKTQPQSKRQRKPSTTKQEK